MNQLRLFDEVVDHALAVCRYREPLDARIFIIVASNDEALVEQSPYSSLHLPFVKAALLHGLCVAGSAARLARNVQQQRRAVAGHIRPIDSAQKLRQIPTRIGGVWWTTPTHFPCKCTLRRTLRKVSAQLNSVRSPGPASGLQSGRLRRNRVSGNARTHNCGTRCTWC